MSASPTTSLCDFDLFCFFLTTPPFSLLLCKMLVLIMPISGGCEGEVDFLPLEPRLLCFYLNMGDFPPRILEGRPQGRNEFQL